MSSAPIGVDETAVPAPRSARGIPIGRRGVASPIQVEIKIGRRDLTKVSGAREARALRSEMAREGHAVAREIATEARRLAPSDLGRLRSATRPGVRIAGDVVTPLVSIDVPYAANVELGRRPGARMPPPSALVGWVRRNLGLTGRAARSAAFAIARKIGRRGIRGRKMLAKAVRGHRARTRDRFRASLVSWKRKRFGGVA